MEQKVEFKKATTIPEARGLKIHERTRDAILELSRMRVGEIVHLDIEAQVMDVFQEETQRKYLASIHSARKHVSGAFQVCVRGRDIFVHRLQ